tara:strand:- start:410 stop:961 length:552 start_codon:yes stop_codon:yes gene_type:complete
MKRVLVPIAPGFEEIETITVIDILRRANIEVVSAGTEPGEITGSRDVKIVPDALLKNVVNDENFDMIVLPGGLEGTTNLKKDKYVREIIQRMYQQGKYTSAICAAPTVLSAIGITIGKNVTSHPSVKEALQCQSYSEERVVVDGQIITSRSPGTAMEFAMKLVEILVGKDKVEEINKGVLARL